jgi:hypothetical protein
MQEEEKNDLTEILWNSEMETDKSPNNTTDALTDKISARIHSEKR